MIVHAEWEGDGQSGEITAFRLNPLAPPDPDDTTTWSWTYAVKGQPDQTGTIEHRHSAGPWALLAAIAEHAQQ